MRGAEGGREREGVVRGEDAVLPPHRQGLPPASAGTARARARGRERERERGREGREGKTAHGCCHCVRLGQEEAAHAVCRWRMVDSCMARVDEQGSGSWRMVDSCMVRPSETAVCPWWKVDSCMARLGALGGWWIRAWRDLVSKECTSTAGPLITAPAQK